MGQNLSVLLSVSEHPQSKKTTTDGSKTVGDTVTEGNNHQGRMHAVSYATVGLGLTIFWFFNYSTVGLGLAFFFFFFVL